MSYLLDLVKRLQAEQDAELGLVTSNTPSKAPGGGSRVGPPAPAQTVVQATATETTVPDPLTGADAGGGVVGPEPAADQQIADPQVGPGGEEGS